MQTINHSLSLKGDDLYIEGLRAADLAERFGTPLFVLSESHLRHNLQRYQHAFAAHWGEGEVRIMPAFKACPLVAVRSLLSQLSCGCDVFGPGELEGAVRGGVTPAHISVNGSIKDANIIRRAIDLGAQIVLDSPRELQLCIEQAKLAGRAARILLRLKPFMAELETHSDFVPELQIREMTQMIKYGIPTSELMAMLPSIDGNPHIDLLGVHVHMGRHSKKTEVWQAWVRHCVLLMGEIAAKLPSWRPQIIDIGGGFASFSDRDTDVAVQGYEAPSLEQIAEQICTSLRTALAEIGMSGQGICLELEPGRGLHGDTGVHLTRVHNVKHESQHRPRQWVELDTSEVFLAIGGLNFSAPFDYIYANRAAAEPSETVDMVGQTCNAELLFHQVAAPQLAAGDTVALLNTGAYIEPMATNFNALPRPGTVLVSGAQAEMIKQHESVNEVFSRDVIPERLQGDIVREVSNHG